MLVSLLFLARNVSSNIFVWKLKKMKEIIRKFIHSLMSGSRQFQHFSNIDITQKYLCSVKSKSRQC